MSIKTLETKPFEGQKPGTSGLRKKVKVVKDGLYLHNFVQSIFNALGDELVGKTLLISGDGRYYNKEAIHIACGIAAANGVARVWIGQDGLMSTPAGSCVIREREDGICAGGILLTASHNPGGPENDFGIKYNTGNGAPAVEALTDAIFEHTKTISEIKMIEIPAFDLSKVGTQELIPGKFVVEIIDPVEDWMKSMKSIFDFDAIKQLVKRPDFSFVYDSMFGVASPYAKRLFVDELGGLPSCLLHCEAKEDFGGLHPDPNLTYAEALVQIMKPLDPVGVNKETPDFGAAGDGDNDRNMVLGKGFFVTPSDSVAVIAAYAQEAIPYFKGGVKGLARSMPTSSALDAVAEKLGVTCYEVPTGWKFFANLMDADKLSICGEESFGTGSEHVREKDGLWAVLAWLAILAHKNREAGKPLVSVKEIVEAHWNQFGRNFYTRYDYEECDSDKANAFMTRLRDVAEKKGEAQLLKTLVPAVGYLSHSDDFEYKDPIDGSVSSNQGVRFIFDQNDLSAANRLIFRLSGTGSSGATIRMYIEKRETDPKKFGLPTADVLKDLVEASLQLCKIQEFTGRDKPTVIT